MRIRSEYLWRSDLYWDYYLAYGNPKYLREALFWRCCHYYGKRMALECYPTKE